MSLAELQALERSLAGKLLRVRARLREARLHARVLEFVRQHPGCSANAVTLGVRGQRAGVLAALRQLRDAGRLAYLPGGWRQGSAHAVPDGTSSAEPQPLASSL